MHMRVSDRRAASDHSVHAAQPVYLRPDRPDGLARSLKSPELFALGFGGIVGAGWVVAIGGWLEQAGPGGAIVAFAIGGVVMSLVGVCYAEITTTLPVSGGE